jgi:hypothetical protein
MAEGSLRPDDALKEKTLAHYWGLCLNAKKRVDFPQWSKKRDPDAIA